MILSNEDLATLTNRLQTPMIVRDILNGEGALTDDVQMGLHEILSDDQPDSALLSIALCARAIARHCTNNTMLEVSSDRIINEYGPIWLRNAQDKTLDDNLVFETLAHIPEDLEGLAGLLDYHAVMLRGEEAGEICKILSTQARAQALIAETFLEAFEGTDEAPWEMQHGFDPVIANDVMANDVMKSTDNIIAFPGVSA